jgi:hypothetical protein
VVLFWSASSIGVSTIVSRPRITIMAQTAPMKETRAKHILPIYVPTIIGLANSFLACASRAGLVIWA